MKMWNKSRQGLYEVIRFGIVGVIATFIHYGIYLVLNFVMISWIAYSIGYGISFLCNFYLSNKFTFKTKPTMTKGLGFGLSCKKRSRLLQQKRRCCYSSDVAKLMFSS